MIAKLARVIKKENVQVDGTIKLEYETNYDEIASENSHQAKIVSSDGQCALIEVSCGCGQKFYLKCNYSDMVAASE